LVATGELRYTLADTIWQLNGNETPTLAMLDDVVAVPMYIADPDVTPVITPDANRNVMYSVPLPTAFNAYDADVANELDTALDADVANDAVPVSGPVKDPVNEPVAIIVSVLTPVRASIVRVTCSA
jgi:hypothetical protein